MTLRTLPLLTKGGEAVAGLPKLPSVLQNLHISSGWIVAWITGAVGLWGVLMTRRETVPTAFYWAVGGAIVLMMAQVVVGVAVMSVLEIEPGSIHLFYGIVISVTFAFAYIYRAQFRKRPALYLGLLLLFVMGLAMRGIVEAGRNF